MENKEIKYISDEKFKKLTKKQQMEMPEQGIWQEIPISRLVLVHTNRKSSGYNVGAFFAYTDDKGWWRAMTYDCWSIKTDINNPTINVRYSLMRGDFQNGGIQLFSFIDEHHQAYLSYGGEIIIKKK